ncbi:hypothetical protein Barb7_02128 [Bacteroidales bacterium Barb7]|nr:hypothetical protein Barb7_02128 [Bacteroidales bacterium Barb7]
METSFSPSVTDSRLLQFSKEAGGRESMLVGSLSVLMIRLDLK